jgi:hypothetical protein
MRVSLAHLRGFKEQENRRFTAGHTARSFKRHKKIDKRDSVFQTSVLTGALDAAKLWNQFQAFEGCLEAHGGSFSKSNRVG